MSNRFLIRLIFIWTMILFLLSDSILAQEKLKTPANVKKAESYLQVVKTFGLSLSEGAARPVNDAKNPARKGVWPTRIEFKAPAVGTATANMSYESGTLSLFRTVSEITDDGRFRVAANHYVEDFLKHGQDSEKGFLAWGPGSSLSIDSLKSVGETEENHWHQLIPRTTPWDLLWDSHPAATRKSIASLKHHFADPLSGQFYQQANVATGKPRIEIGQASLDAALYAYAFAFLYRKTGEREWITRARRCVDKVFYSQHPRSGLIPIKQPTISQQSDSEEGKEDSSKDEQELQLAGSEQVLFAYFLVKAWKEVPYERSWADSAIAMVREFDFHSYQSEKNNWRSRFLLDGAPLEEQTEAPILPIWTKEIGTMETLPAIGRAIIYIGRRTQSKECIAIARKMADQVVKKSYEEGSSLESLAFNVNFLLDMHDATKHRDYLNQAIKLTDLGIKKYWTGRLFKSFPDATYYDASHGAGEFCIGLYRIYLKIHNVPAPILSDWSF